MKKYFYHYLFATTLLMTNHLWSQQSVAINTDGSAPNVSAILDIKSTSKGMLLPRMTSAQRTAIASPAQGLQVFDITTGSFWFYNSGWIEINTGAASTSFWSLGSGGSIYNNDAWKVLMGTTDIGPGYVNIKAPLNASGLFMSETGTTSADFISFGTYSGGGTISTRFGNLLANFGGGFTIANQANAPLMFQAYNAERMRITPAGYVGINTSTPTSQLEVQTATGAAGITHTNGTIRLTTMMNSATSAAIGTTTNHPLFFFTNNTFPPAVTISTSGNLGIGGSLASAKVEAFTTDVAYGFLQTSAAGIRVGTSTGGGGWYGTLSNHPLYLHSNNGSGLIALLQNGYVGIGTSLPSDKLTVQTPTNNYGLVHTDGNVQLTTFVGGSSITAGWLGTKSNHPIGFFTNNGGAQMVIMPSGLVGINTIAPTSLLHLAGNSASNGYGELILEELDNDYARLNFKTTNAANSLGNFWTIAAYNNNTRANEKLNFYNNASGDVMTLAGNGNVGIGTTNPSYKLSVNGSIQSKEVRVETGWADYVFEKNYQLKPLSEVENFIKINKHLPGIPSAEEIQKNGLAVGEVQTKMMAKIEELTLYIIDLQKQVTELKKSQK